ncbi:MAG: hypothetical protein LBI82_03260 [Dysgonamonadaceae bacterium]|jgi:hypothetical protein|nr:hypothetical protein [Dysgonamonadaceae bacterium]
MKQCIIICITIICYTHINAQDNPVANYLQQVGEYAEIYNGKMEKNYNMVQYANLPYYINSDFTETSIVYKKNHYPNQKARLDLFREQLVVMPKGTQYAVEICSSDVESVYMYGKTFVWLAPPKENKLKTGYYIHLAEGEKMQLFCKVSYSLWQKLQQNGAVSYFEPETRYYLRYDNRYYPIKNQSSFSKLFPRYKKQINKFAKDHQLNFKRLADNSFVSLAGYCEELLNSTGQ